jgi:flagellar biosynthesis protein FliR
MLAVAAAASTSLDAGTVVILFCAVVAFIGVMITPFVTLLRSQMTSSSEALGKQIKLSYAALERQLEQQSTSVSGQALSMEGTSRCRGSHVACWSW